MARVITFSRTFPAYHPKAGEPTEFVERIVKSFMGLGISVNEIDQLCMDNIGLNDETYNNGFPKYHTIRAGNRWKAGDMFSPRVWSGKPYRSQQIKLSDDVEIKKVWPFKIKIINKGLTFMPYIDDKPLEQPQIEEIAKNDGLSTHDFSEWFVPRGKKFIVGIPVFVGQILCWNENIEY